MLEKLKPYTDKVIVPVTTFVSKFTVKLSPNMRKAFCVVVACAWLAALLVVSLLKVIPLVGTVAVVAWLVLSVLVGKVLYDVWQTTKTPPNANP